MPRLRIGLAIAVLPATGAWPAVSMNKKYPAGSVQSLFMQDAATAFASMALVEADAARRR